MKFLAHMRVTTVDHEADNYKSMSEESDLRKFIEAYWLDEFISDESWTLLLKGEKLSFFSDREITIDMTLDE